MTQQLPGGLSQAIGPQPGFTHFPVANTITLGGIVLPGKWTLLEAPKKFGWQIQQGYGLSGAFIFPKGDELIVPKFRGEFWADSDYASFREIYKQLFLQATFTVPGTSQTQTIFLFNGVTNPTDLSNPLVSKAIGIDHPALKMMGLTSVVLLEMGPVLQDEGGLWSLELTFLQFRPAIIAKPPPKQVIPDAPKATPTAQDAQDVETQKLTNQLTSLLGQ